MVVGGIGGGIVVVVATTTINDARMIARFAITVKGECGGYKATTTTRRSRILRAVLNGHNDNTNGNDNDGSKHNKNSNDNKNRNDNT